MRLLARLFLATVVFVCLAAAMIAILETPSVQTSMEDSTDASTEPNARPAVSATSPAASGVSAAPVRNAGTTSPRPISPVPPLPDFVLAGTPVVVESVEPVMKITTPSAPVFSSNTGVGSVVRRLEEGEQVETGLTVLTEEGLWVEVRLNQRPFGFVRGEDLGLRFN